MPLYSYSRIGCFANCRLQYKFRYVEKPDIVKPTGIEAFMGSMVHDSLEQCYRLAGMQKLLTLEELLALYQRLWKENKPEKLKIVKKELSEKDYYETGYEALKKYYKRYQPFDQEIVLGLEKRVMIELDDAGQYKMVGYIDRLTRDDAGRIRIHDYKTNSNLPTQEEIDREPQLALYQLAVEKMWPDQGPVELVWHFVRFDTPLVSIRDKGQLDKLRYDYMGKIDEIEAAVELGNFPATESALCNWCDFVEICPAKGGSGGVKSDQIEIKLPSDEQCLKLVDEFLDLDQKKKDVDKRRDEIKQILISGGIMGTNKFFPGSGGRGLNVSLQKSNKLPGKSADAEKYDQITELVKGSGMYEEYSTVDLRALQKAYDGGKLPQEMRGQLSQFSFEVIVSVVRIKKSPA